MRGGRRCIFGVPCLCVTVSKYVSNWGAYLGRKKEKPSVSRQGRTVMLNTPTQGESVCGVRFLRHVSTSQLVVGVCMCFLSVASESHDRITEVAEGSHLREFGFSRVE